MRKDANRRIRRRGWALIVIVLGVLLRPSCASALVPPAGTPIVNRAAVAYSDVNGNRIRTESVEVITALSGAPSLHIGKLESSNPVEAGGTLTYTIEYENLGNLAATGVTVVDSLSGYVLFQSASPGNIVTPGPPGGGTVGWNLGTLEPGEKGTLTITVIVEDPLAAGTAIDNTVRVDSREGAADEETISTPVGSGPNLAIIKEASPDNSVAPGGTVTYRLTYLNRGNSGAGGVTIRDELPAGTGLVPGSVTGGGTLTGNVLSWYLGTIGPGESGTVSFAVTLSPLLPEGTVISNRAEALSSGQEVLFSNTVTHTVSAGLSLTVFKESGAEPVKPGDSATYTIRVINSGTSDLSGVVIRDPLPARTAFVDVDGGGVLAGADAVWNIGTLTAGEERIFHLTVRIDEGVPGGERIENVVEASSNEAPGQRASTSTLVASVPRLVITKTSDRSEPVAPGQELTYTIGVMNGGNVAIDDVVVRDTLPEYTAFISATGGGELSGGVVTWRIDRLDLSAAKTFRLLVRVDPSLSGGAEIINTAAVTSPVTEEETAAVSNSVAAVPLLRIAKTADHNDNIYVGNTVAYTIRISNDGTVPLSGVTVTDIMPEKASFVSADEGGTLRDGEILWNVGTLNPGDERNYHIVLLPEPSGPGETIENRAVASAVETGDQWAAADTTIKCRTPAEVVFLDEKGADATSYAVGDVICIEVRDGDRNLDPGVIETVTVVLDSPRTDDEERLTLSEVNPETGDAAADTGVFRVCLPSDDGPAVRGNGVFSVATDSTVFVTYDDPLDALCGYSTVTTADILIDPYGVVFDSATGVPVAGTVVTLYHAGGQRAGTVAGWPEGEADSVTTGEDGSFQFPLVPAGTYYFAVEPGGGYAFPSEIPDNELPPGFTVGAGSRGEAFDLEGGMEPLNLDIPVDPPRGQLVIDKQASRQAASIGDIVRYTITLSNSGSETSTAPVTGIRIIDTMPHGIIYLDGSSEVDGKKYADPETAGRRLLEWSVPDLAQGEEIELVYRAVVGPDSQRGDGINAVHAEGASLGRGITSNTDRVKIDISEGVFTSCGTIIGKVFIDRNGDRIQQNQEDGSDDEEECLEEPGIPGVVLYLEDGTRVKTDSRGKFSIYGVCPGTHVLRIDETTLPEGVVPVSVNNRFMRDPMSQFVDMYHGGLFKANFAVEEKRHGEPVAADMQPAEPPVETVVPESPPSAEGTGMSSSGREHYCIQVASARTAEALADAYEKVHRFAHCRIEKIGEYYTVRVGVFENPDDALAILDEIRTHHSDAFLRRCLPYEERIVGPTAGLVETVEGRIMTVPVTEESAGTREGVERLPAVAAIPPGDTGESEARGPAPPVTGGIPPSDRALEEQILSMTPELRFLSPRDGDVSPVDSVRVLIKAPLGTGLRLAVNGKAVSAGQIGRQVSNREKNVLIYEYVGVSLERGSLNRLSVVMTDPFGNVRGEESILITTIGGPADILIVPEHDDVPADGRSIVPVRVTVLDERGYPVTSLNTLTVMVSEGAIIDDDADPTTAGHQIACHEGKAVFTLRAPFKASEAEITAVADTVEKTVPLFFKPDLRDLMVVGVGEFMIGHGGAGGDFSYLKQSEWFDDGWHKDGRGAVFAKGKLYDDILLTAAYDSEKEKKDELFDTPTGDLDSEDTYPIYGDESELGYEAVSQDRLYIKLEKNKSSLLYGDYHTNLDETILGAYNRSFNGLKYEFNADRFSLRSFGSHTDQTQVIDTIPGKGISGFYYLDKTPIVEGSEQVVIEVRDRRRPGRVLSRESRARNSDYTIDYDMGTILFKEPIPSHDSDYNPLYIVVTYESEGSGDEYYIYGGRGALRPAEWLELGVTGITEEQEAGNYHLLGGDVTLHLPADTTVKAEYAETESLFEVDNSLSRQSGGAWSFEAESRPVEGLLVGGYYRELEDYFNNLSAVDTARGSTKYGFDAAYQLTATTTVQGKFFNEEDDLNNMYYRYGSVGVQTKIEKTTVDVEFSREVSGDAYVPPASDTARSPFDISEETPDDLTAARVGVETDVTDDLTIQASHKHNLSCESYHTSQAGLNYRFSEVTRFYVREEYQKYQEQTETRTLMGVETQMVENTVAYNEYRLADGADGYRNQSVVGLRNKFMLSDHLTGNISGEYLKTIRGDERSGEPDAYAGACSLEYLKRKDLKVTTRFEHRNELSDDGSLSYLGEVGVAYKLDPDYSLLLRERYYYEDVGTGGDRTTSRTILGLAYRPVCFDRFNGLAKVEYKYDDNDDAGADSGYREDAFIASTEGVFQVNRRLQVMGRYAGKLAKEDGFDSYTDLIGGRFIYDLTDRVDVGAEYGIMTNHTVNSRTEGGSVEVGYCMVKNLWLSLGYSFVTFDEDLTGDGYRGEGFYLRVRFKFDEETLKKMRERLL